MRKNIAIIILAGLLLAGSIFFLRQSPIQKGLRLLSEGQYAAAQNILNSPYPKGSREEKRLLVLGLALKKKKKWYQARDVFNKIFVNGHEQIKVRFAIPPFVQDPRLVYDFKKKVFETEDMRYIWRTLKQAELSQRLTARDMSTREKALRILDYVYRHVRFGTIEDGFMNDKPFNVLVKGQGYCDELAWITNQLLRSAGCDALRLVLNYSHEEPSPHTISMVSINDNWVGLDPSRGLVLQHPERGVPRTFPKNFRVNPTPETELPVDEPLPYSMRAYVRTIEKITSYGEVAQAFIFADPFVDREAEAGMLRFLYLDNRLSDIFPIPNLSAPYTHIAIPVFDEETEVISHWRGISVEYIYASTAKINQRRRLYSRDIFAYLKELRPARLALISGDYDPAGTLFQELLKDPDIDPRAREDIEYYLAVIAYEKGDAEKARPRFLDFIREYPQSRWKDRVYYQLACLAHASGNETEKKTYLQRARQDGPTSLFTWMEKKDMI